MALSQQYDTVIKGIPDIAQGKVAAVLVISKDSCDQAVGMPFYTAAWLATWKNTTDSYPSSHPQLELATGQWTSYSVKDDTVT